jgi:hypothetical protein
MIYIPVMRVSNKKVKLFDWTMLPNINVSLTCDLNSNGTVSVSLSCYAKILCYIKLDQEQITN